MPRNLGRLQLSCLALALLAGVMVFAGQAAARPAAQDVLVSVGGPRLHMVVERGEGPVVVFESGAGMDATEWTQVMAGLSARTSASLVAYDREGHGKSDPLTTPYDVHEEVVRLHKALYSLGLDHPVVLVGHSYGGFLIQLYANIYPQDVAAMVYVDANTVEGLGGLEGAAKIEAMAKAAVAKGEQGKSEARMVQAFVATIGTLLRNPAPCGVPITVISQGKGDLLEMAPHWFEGHQALAARTGAIAVRAEGSGHIVPLEAPQVVVDAVLARLGDVKADRPRAWFVDAAARCGTAPPEPR